MEWSVTSVGSSTPLSSCARIWSAPAPQRTRSHSRSFRREAEENLRGLVPLTDVVVDNFKMGTLERWVFDDVCFPKSAPPRSALHEMRVRVYRPQGQDAGIRPESGPIK